MEQDTKSYIDQGFEGIARLIDTHMHNVSDDIGELKKDAKATLDQAKLTNSRINKLEDFKENAPCIKYREHYEDASFFIRHPVIFTGIIVVLVIITIYQIVNS